MPIALIFASLRGMSVFTDVEVEISHLRDCQQGAAVAARDHYGQSGADRQALIQLPTGTGKSALIATLPFYVPCERVLVLVPNLSLVKQMKEDLDVIDSPRTNEGYSGGGVEVQGNYG